MESLANYDSDDDPVQNLNTREDTLNIPPTDVSTNSTISNQRRKLQTMSNDGTNYESIQMDLSEESNVDGDNLTATTLSSQSNYKKTETLDPSNVSSDQERQSHTQKMARSLELIGKKSSKSIERSREDDKQRNRNSSHRERDKERTRDRDFDRRDRTDRDRQHDHRDKHRKHREDNDNYNDFRRDRNNDYDNKNCRRPNRDNNKERDYYSRDRDYRERNRDKKDMECHDGKEKDYRNNRTNQRDRDVRNKEKNERHIPERKRRSVSRDGKDYKRLRSRSKSRSKSGDRPIQKHVNTSSLSSTYNTMPLNRFERNSMKVQQLKKMGIDIMGSATSMEVLINDNKNTITTQSLLLSVPSSSLSSSSTITTTSTGAATTTTTIAPGLPSNMAFTINPRYAEQIQRRKLLWANKPAEVDQTKNTTNKWEDTKFSHDADGKMASKFLRLMGMKDTPKPLTAIDNGHPSANSGNSTNTGDPKMDLSQKQAEMFSTMEQQYEVARQVTHTMRGMGLGFGSHQRQY